MSASDALSAWVNVHFTRLGARLFRNNVGEAWAGHGTQTDKGGVYIAKPSRIRYGLAVGSSDKIGWTPVTITADMVGSVVAVFTSVEEKSLAYPMLTPEQRNWLDQVTRSGGIGYVARETKDDPVLERWGIDRL
jgi:hypothetical protein